MTKTNAVQQLLTRLQDEAKMSPAAVSEALGGRVSSRTVYRWINGETEPHQKSDLRALEDLVREKLGEGEDAVREEGSELGEGGS